MLSWDFERAIRRHCELKDYVPEEYWQLELQRIYELFAKKEAEAQDYKKFIKPSYLKL